MFLNPLHTKARKHKKALVRVTTCGIFYEDEELFIDSRCERATLLSRQYHSSSRLEHGTPRRAGPSEDECAI